MSSTLTENVVLVRTRSHDLNSVKKLNCWGCTLKDVSIVNRMPNVEVISLSINSIDTLQYFASCTMLQELYLRKNEIKDINEILHLSQLQFLKKLSLEDNPCANVDNYRLTVLKALPNLEYLDNIKVTAEELYQAEKLGRELVWPGTEADDLLDDENTNDTITAEYNHCYEAASTAIHHESQTSPQNTISTANCGLSALAPEFQPIASAYNGSSDLTSSNNSNYCPNNNSNRNSYANSHQTTVTANNQAIKPQEPQSTPTNSKKTNMAKANSLSDYNIYNTNGNFRCSSPALSGNTYEPMNEYYENGQTNNNGQTYYMPNNNNSFRSNSSSRTNVQSASANQQRLPKGGKNRNANILSAVLCLIKELDYGSLEVVDTTIHCRMEEMED